MTRSADWKMTVRCPQCSRKHSIHVFYHVSPSIPDQEREWCEECWEAKHRPSRSVAPIRGRGDRGPWVWGDEADPSPLYLELERRRKAAQEDDTS